jgi:hypothetical protein
MTTLSVVSSAKEEPASRRAPFVQGVPACRIGGTAPPLEEDRPPPNGGFAARLQAVRSQSDEVSPPAI